MKITFLGTGSAFTIKNYHTNMIIENNNRRILFDCGGDIRQSLHHQGLTPDDLDAVYISHLHSDHVGGLEYLACMRMFVSRNKNKLRLMAEAQLMEDLWNKSLVGGLATTGTDTKNINHYFDQSFLYEDSDHPATWNQQAWRLVRNKHMFNQDTMGLLLSDGVDKRVYFTGDSIFNEDDPNYKIADIIIQDCETSPSKSGVHAHFDDLTSLPDEVKIKMHLVHYQDNVVEDHDEWQDKAHDNGFQRFAFRHIGDTIAV
jgi:ribonuclease BN (tRNA processing enzyme)